MAYNITRNKVASREQLAILTNAFHQQKDVLSNPSYNEAQLRIDFINPLLKTLGWDTDNEVQSSQFLREVIQEEPIDVSEDDIITKKNPDYTLRIKGSRKLFIEAKKVSIDIERSVGSCFQTRRYGWSANLGISVLTNFDKLIVYDCRYKPEAQDQPSTARYKTFSYNEFVQRFDELYDLLSFEAVMDGTLDQLFSQTQADLTTFDSYFLQQIERWRLKLAENILSHHPELQEDHINFVVQRLLNRIVFLRICEDREIEVHDRLKGVADYEELKDIFLASDDKYNSGLFDFIEDTFSLNIGMDNDVLLPIFQELYYPESPYDFAVVDPAILSQIYERYLGSHIAVGDTGEISIVEEPEVAASSGVVPTPTEIVKLIIIESLDPLILGKTPAEIARLKIADICCGSGTFLIALFDYLIEKITLALISSGVDNPDLLVNDGVGSTHLTLFAKRNILTNCIYGVDINPYAIEVTKFSLFLKLLENENAATISKFQSENLGKVLPSLDGTIKTGNSLVDNSYFTFDDTAITNDDLLYKVKPFNWPQEFPFLSIGDGFDAIIGNPPYVRIQNMAKYLSEEIRYYQHPSSGYTVASKDTFDKYYLFIQRALQLIKADGIVGYIVPHKFFITRGGLALRHLIATRSGIAKIIHFGVLQLFPGRSTYTAILVLRNTSDEHLKFKRVNSNNYSSEIDVAYSDYPKQQFMSEPWVFLSKSAESVFNVMDNAGTVSLNAIAEIAVGLQTSADDIYIFQPVAETDLTFSFIKDGVTIEIERAICKPCLYKHSFSAFDTVSGNAQLIFPYNVTNQAIPYDEDFFETNFPLAWEYLNHYRDRLSVRSINGGEASKWYQFGRSQSLTRFHNAQKLIWPVLSTQPSYIFDSKNLQFTGGGNGPYYSLFTLAGYSPLYILGLLMHPLMEARIKARASEFRGAYYSHGKQFIENLPIRTIDFNMPEDVRLHDNIVDIVQEIIDTKVNIQENRIPARREVLSRKFSYLNSTLISLVNGLYGISEQDIQTVCSDPNMPNEIDE